MDAIEIRDGEDGSKGSWAFGEVSMAENGTGYPRGYRSSWYTAWDRSRYTRTEWRRYIERHATALSTILCHAPHS